MNVRPALYTARYWTVLIILAIGILALVCRLINLQVVSKNFLRSQGNARMLRVVAMPAYRGIITDRNGEPLAVSTPVDSVWAVPTDVLKAKVPLNRLAKLLGVTADELEERFKLHSKREFIYLKRQVDPPLAEAIKALAIPGVYVQREYRRYYPTGEVTAHVVGFTDVDDKGQEGLELAYDDWLRGRPGSKLVIKDRKGNTVENVESIHDARPGKPLVLSIDRRIQYLAYRELKAAVARFQARSGSLVMLDVNTGEVLAMVSQPSLNPNNRGHLVPAYFRNRAVTDTFEPGSVVKTLSAATALANHKVSTSTLIDTSPGKLILHGKLVQEIKNHDYGKLDLAGILVHSSNVGIAKVVLMLPPDKLWQSLSAFGLGASTGSGFPGESTGRLVNKQRWDPFSLATLSFGYGVSVTTLQLAQAYATLAAGGIKHPVTFIAQTGTPAGERVIDANTAHAIVRMLEKVVLEAAKPAHVAGYRVGGKTGTSRLVGAGGYEKEHHIGTFAGVAPITNPRLAMVVVINDPEVGGYYGVTVSAPVFSRVMAGALRLLNVPPDDPNATSRWLAQQTVAAKPAGAKSAVKAATKSVETDTPTQPEAASESAEEEVSED